MILIIGCGWYGAHLGMLLKSLNIDFAIAEAENEIFTKTSFNNQNRLHLGFHYPRNKITRELCRNGYDRFLKRYKHLTTKLDKNIYCISNESNVDFGTYKIIMDSIDVSYEECKDDNITDVEGMIDTGELFIDNCKAKMFFEKELNEYIYTNWKIDNDILKNTSHKYEYIFNCTNNTFQPQEGFYYEKTISLIYEKKNKTNVTAYTIMDGLFSSLYPFNINKGYYSLTDVEYTPLIKTHDYKEITKYGSIPLQYLKENMETKITKYYNNFKEDYEYKTYTTSLKIKKKNNSDERDCYITKTNNIVNVCCNKITGIFKFEDYVKQLIKKIDLKI